MVQRRSLAETIQPVPETQNRVAPEHAGAGIPHDQLHLVAPIALITMDRTMGAGRFFGAKPAAIQPQGGVVQLTAAFPAKAVRCGMAVVAMAPNHCGHRFPFSHQTPAGGYVQRQWEFGNSHVGPGCSGLNSVSNIENCLVAWTACARFGGIYSRSPAFNGCGWPARKNSHSPDKTWIKACCVDVCSLNSWPSANPNNATREWAVRSSVRLTMPLGANRVSAASDRIFSRPASINGCSLTPIPSQKPAERVLT